MRHQTGEIVKSFHHKQRLNRELSYSKSNYRKVALKSCRLVFHRRVQDDRIFILKTGTLITASAFATLRRKNNNTRKVHTAETRGYRQKCSSYLSFGIKANKMHGDAVKMMTCR